MAKKTSPNPKPDVGEGEQTFRLLFRNNPMPMWVYDSKTLAFLEVNEAAVEKYGYTHDEFQSLTIKDIRPQEDVEHLLAVVKKKQPTIQHSGEWRHRLKDGRVIDVEITTHGLDFKGRKAMFVMAQDITERKQAEQALRANEQQYRSLYIAAERREQERKLLDRVRIALAHEHDLPATLRVVVEAIAETFGYTLVSLYLLQGEILVIQHQVGYPQIIKEIPISKGITGRTARTGRPILLENIRSDREFLGAMEGIVSEVCVPLFSEGKVTGVLNVESTLGIHLSDADLNLMTALSEYVSVAIERARFYTQVRESEERFRNLAETTAAVIVLYDAQRIYYVNPAVLKLTGYTQEELLQKKFLDVVHPASQSLIRDRVAKRLRGEPVSEEAEIKITTRDGLERWISLRGSQTTYLGKPVGLGTAFDITERKQAEDAVRESEQRFRTAFSNAPIGMALVDLHERFLQVNQALCDILGYTEEQLLNTSVPAITHPDDIQVEAAYKKQTASGEIQSFHFEKRYLHADGHIVWGTLNVSVVADEAGNPLYYIGQLADITSRKQAEEALREREEQYHTLVEQIPAIVYIDDATAGPGHTLYISPQLETILGNTPEEWLNGNLEFWSSHVHPDDRAHALAEYMRGFQSGEQINSEYRMIAADGHIVWIRDQGMILRDENGKPRLIHGVMYDITEHMQAEELLRESEGKLRKAQHFARVGSWTWNIKTNQLDWSDEMYNIFGLDKQTFSGVLSDVIERAIHPDDRAKVEQANLAVINEGKPSPLEYRVVWGDGTVRVVWAEAGEMIQDEAGTPILLSGTVQDITERKQAEEKLLLQSTALNAAANAIMITDRDGTVEWVNPAFNALTGYTLEEAVGKNPRDLVKSGKQDRAIYKNLWDTILAGEVWRGELVNRRKDGSLYDEEETITPLKNADGMISHFIAIKQDISERKRAEDALLASEEQYRTLFETAPIGVGVADQAGNLLTFNNAMLVPGGYTREDVLKIGNVKGLYYDPDGRDQALALFRKQGFLNQYGVKFKRKDGTSYDALLTLTPAKFKGQSCVQALVEDVTERRQAEKALAGSEAELRALFESMQDVVMVIDREGVYRKIAPTNPGLLYRPAQGMLGRNLRDVFPAEQAEVFIGTIQQVLEEQQTARIEYELLIGERLVWFATSISPMNDDTTVWVARDITERKQAEKDLRQRLTELEALHNVSTSLRAAQTVDEALTILLDETLAALETDAGTILLYHPPSGELRNTSPRGWFKDIQNTPFKVGEGVAGIVFASGQPYFADEFDRDPLPHPSSRPKFRAGWGGACLPIRAGSQIVGVLFVSVPLPHQITLEQKKLLNSLAEMTGATLHRMRLYDETARRAQEFASLYETSNALSAENDLNTLLQAIVEHAKTLLASATSGIYLHNKEHDDLELMVDTAPAPNASIGIRLQFGEGVAGHVAQTRQPLRIEDYSTWEGRSLKYEHMPIRAILGVPMLYGGELIGVLTADEIGDSVRKFTEADEHLLSLFASQAAGVLHSARLREETIHRLDHLQALRSVDQAINSSLDMRITLNVLLSHSLSQLGVDAADVLLLVPFSNTLEFTAGQGFRTHIADGASVSIGESFAGQAIMEHRTIMALDYETARQNPQFGKLWMDEGFSYYCCVPLIAKGEVKGVLEVYRRTVFTPDPEWVEFLETLAGQAAIAIDNAQLFENLQRANMDLALAYDVTIEGWSRAMDLRDKETEGHTKRVTDLTVTLAKAMGIKDKEILNIRRGALLHDIGKMGVPDHILFKEEKLTDEEWAIMHKHPQFAYEMLMPIAYLRNALDIPHCHHEKWDGTGYPQGLKGEQIPLTARVFAIMDVWDALTSDRPYRKKWTKKKTLAYIREQRGMHFDPEVVDAFLKIIERK